MGFYKTTSELCNAYIWDYTPTLTFDWLLVWWWGWGWRSRCRAWGWGWAWWLIHCEWDTSLSWSYCIVIWAWGAWQCYCVNQVAACRSWCSSCFGSIVAYWGWGWGWMNTCTGWCAWATWGSWWGWPWCTKTAWTWCNWQWHNWGAWCVSGWGWGGFGTIGWTATGTNVWGAWGSGFQSCISGTATYYAAWWWGWSCNNSPAWGTCGGWNGWCYRTAWWNATTYWSGWWWGGYTLCNSCCMGGWNGCQWVFYISYDCSSRYNVTWGQCCYVCNGKCIHRFTSNGTLTIN